jgi:inosine-uridine nucleoside N-ribohydrolase
MVQDNIRVILDCDTRNEIDDQLAISYALGVGNLDVLGVISVHDTVADGQTSVELYQAEAQHIVKLCGRPDVPCWRGASRPMETIDEAVESEGLDFLLAAASEGPLTLVATGPATDIAAFALLAPSDVAKNVSILWAGGFPDPGTWARHKFGELNARADIHAWRRTFQSARNLKVLPGWPAVATVAVRWREFAASLKTLNSELGNYLSDLTVEFCEAREAPDMDQVRPEKVLWDIVNVAALSIPKMVRFVELDLPHLDAAGAPDWTRPVGSAPFAMEVDADAIIADFWTALHSLPKVRER